MSGNFLFKISLTITASVLAGIGTFVTLGFGIVTMFVALFATMAGGVLAWYATDAIAKLIEDTEKNFTPEGAELRKEKAIKTAQLASMSEEDRKLIADAQTKVNALVGALSRVVGIQTAVGSKAINVLQRVSQDIVKEMEADQKDLYVVRSWVNVHLDTTLDGIKAFNELQNPSSEIVNQFEITMDGLAGAYSKILHDLRENDMVGVKVQLNVLRDQFTR